MAYELDMRGVASRVGGLSTAFSRTDAAGLWRANEPVGMTEDANSNRIFETLDEGGWSVWYDPDGNLEIVPSDDPYAGNNKAGRITYPAGMAGGGGNPSTGMNYPSDVKRIYMCMSWAVSDNWQGHPTGTNKIHFMTTDDFGGGGDPAFLSYETNLTPKQIVIRHQGPDVTIKSLAPNIETVEILAGQNYLVEVELVMNTPGNLDGEARLWINGTLTTNFSDIEWVNAGYMWNILVWGPIWGGGGGTVTNEMFMEISRLWASRSSS